MCPNMRVSMDCEAKRCFGGVHDLELKKMQQSTFEESKRFECSFFYRIEVQVIRNMSSRLEENTNPLSFVFDRFYDIF